jgi:hypothetical protein
MVMSGMSMAAGFTMAAGMMFVGSALSFVGQITGNEKLTRIGAIVGLAGGVTSLVDNWGSIASAASTSAASVSAEAAAPAAFTAGNTVQDALTQALPLSSGEILGEALSSSPVSSVLAEGAGQGIISGNMASNGASLLGDLSGSGATRLGELGSGLSDLTVSPGSQIGFASGPGASIASNAAASTGNLALSKLGGNTATALGNLGNTAAAPDNPDGGASIKNGPIGQLIEKIKGVPKSFTDWIKENKEFAEISSKMLSGISDSVGAQEAAKIKAEAELEAQQNNFARADELMARYKESVAQLLQQNPIIKQGNLYQDSTRAWIPSQGLNPGQGV